MRPAQSSDLPFLRDLHASFRAAEMALLPWPDARRRSFLDAQFDLQHRHFTRVFPAGDFWVIGQARPPAAPQAIGRLYLDRGEAVWRIVDIGLIAGMRGRGIGAALIDWVQRSAAAAGAARVALHVHDHNPRARALYRRMGFRDSGPPEGHHAPMEWRGPLNRVS